MPETSQNAAAGLQQGDEIVQIGADRISYFDQAKPLLQKYQGGTVDLKVDRKDTGTLTIPVQISDSATIGLFPGFPSIEELTKRNILQVQEVRYSFLEAIPAGINKGVETLGSYAKQLKKIFNPSTGAYKGVGGFAAIGSMFPGTWDWATFWSTTALISIILAFMNVLPIPALDGGHVMFLLYEMVSGRKPSDKFLEYAQMVGFFLLIALLLFANGNDLYKAVFK